VQHRRRMVGVSQGGNKRQHGCSLRGVPRALLSQVLEVEAAVEDFHKAAAPELIGGRPVAAAVRWHLAQERGTRSKCMCEMRG
jgi:hypothetical protein